MQIASLHLYPIKGCRGHAVASLDIDLLGPVGDRRLMLVDPRGRFISQRESPRLATITATLDGDTLSATAPGLGTLNHDLATDGTIQTVSIWASSDLQVVDQGDAVAAWFSSAIGQPCRLVRYGAMTHRPIDPTYSPRPEAATTFTDGYPVLAVTEASLADLNRRLAEPVPMSRFRPNIVVRGGAAWSEDAWRVVTAGAMTFDAVKPCARCLVTTRDQESGATHPQQEPLRTLASFHTIPGLGAIFGQNLVARGGGSIAVGDQVTA